MTTGRDVVLNTFDDGSVAYVGPSGAEELFLKNADGSYQTPPGFKATLTKNSDGTFTLHFLRSDEVWHFNAGGHLTDQKDRNGNTISFSYDPSNGALASITDTQGRQTTFTYDGRGYISTITDPSGRTVSYTRDPNIDNLASYTDAAGKTTSFTYAHPHGQWDLTQITDPMGKVTALTYDAQSRVTAITRETDPNGSGPTTSFAYNDGNVVVTDPNGHATTYYSDNRARITKVVDAYGKTVSTTSYTANDDVSNQTDAYGHTTQYGYQSNTDNLTSVTAPTGSVDQYTYASDQGHPYLLRTYTNPQNHTWSYGYDEGATNTNGNLTSLVRQGEVPVRFTYNSNGTRATATDAKGNVTSYGYDSHGNLTMITPPAPLGQVTVTYDSLSRVHTITDGKGQTRTYTYDPLDRVTRIATSGGPTIDYTYDDDGNLAAQTDPSGTYTYSYDNVNRLIQETQPNATVNYGYDAASNLTMLTDSSGSTTYSYDNDERLASLLEPGSMSPIGFGYDDNGQRTAVDYPNGTSLAMGFDSSQRLTSIVGRVRASGQVLTSFTYHYTGTGGGDTALRQSVDVQYPGETAYTVNYGYDNLDRLASAAGGGHSYGYAYDANGNMTSKTVDGVTTSYTFNNANELTSSGYGFDANGSQTNGAGVFSMASYNPLDQLTSITPTGGSAIGMGYHGIGQAQRVSADSRTFINDQLGLQSETGSPATFFTRDASGTTLGERRGGQSYYFLTDGLGSVVAATDGSGNVVRTFKYTPYGAVTDQTGTLYEPVRYASGYADSAATGGEQLVKFGQRYYDPASGRWTQQDPIDNPYDLQGWNQYKYAGDDPIDFRDPSGELKMCGSGWALFSSWECKAAKWAWNHKSTEIKVGAVVGAAWTCYRWGMAAARVAALTMNPEVVAATGAVGCGLAVGAKFGIQNYYKQLWGQQ
jgi:RHS repeat-associated protein